jgi:hypothetical protein
MSSWSSGILRTDKLDIRELRWSNKFEWRRLSDVFGIVGTKRSLWNAFITDINRNTYRCFGHYLFDRITLFRTETYGLANRRSRMPFMKTNT